MDGMDKTQKLKRPLTRKSIPMICSWCNKLYHIQEYEVGSDKKTGVSHGICPECMKKQEKDLDDNGD
jgi:hypothetical protein